MTKGGVRGGEEEWKREMEGQKLSCVHNRRKQSSKPISSHSRLRLFPLLYLGLNNSNFLVPSEIFAQCCDDIARDDAR
jgi:hypothetical protein